MNFFDIKKLNDFLKKNKLKLSQDQLDQINYEIAEKIKIIKKSEKNKKRKEKLDEQEKKYNTNILSKEKKNLLPSWVKNELKDSKIIGNSKKVILTKSGKKYHIDNKLNDLSGNEWSYFLRSVINTRYPTSGDEAYAHHLRKIHPSPKPPQLMRDIIKFFTKENEIILDYFMGVGGTLLGASLCGRKAIGIDLSSKYISVYKKSSKELKLKEQTTIKGDCLEVLKNQKEINKILSGKKVSLIAIDPPYGDMMSREKTGEAVKKNLSTKATPFTSSKNDLGNMDWKNFLSKFIESIKLSANYLKNNGHIVIFIKDLQPKNKKTNLLHADIIEEVNKLENIHYTGMKIWADESINLYPYGYPFSFVSNQLHQYIMIFKKKL